MRIDELFNRKINWKWKHDNEAIFIIDDIIYIVTFDEMSDDPALPKHFTRSYEVVFTEKAPDDIERWSITNSGNSLAVMATVLEILQDFFNKSQPGTTLLFTAKEPSRQKLYSAMVKRFVKKGWEVFDGPAKDIPKAFSPYFPTFGQAYIITKL